MLTLNNLAQHTEREKSLNQDRNFVREYVQSLYNTPSPSTGTSDDAASSLEKEAYSPPLLDEQDPLANIGDDDEHRGVSDRSSRHSSELSFRSKQQRQQHNQRPVAKAKAVQKHTERHQQQLHPQHKQKPNEKPVTQQSTQVRIESARQRPRSQPAVAKTTLAPSASTPAQQSHCPRKVQTSASPPPTPSLGSMMQNYKDQDNEPSPKHPKQQDNHRHSLKKGKYTTTTVATSATTHPVMLQTRARKHTDAVRVERNDDAGESIANRENERADDYEVDEDEEMGDASVVQRMKRQDGSSTAITKQIAKSGKKPKFSATKRGPPTLQRASATARKASASASTRLHTSTPLATAEVPKQPPLETFGSSRYPRRIRKTVDAETSRNKTQFLAKEPHGENQIWQGREIRSGPRDHRHARQQQQPKIMTVDSFLINKFSSPHVSKDRITLLGSTSNRQGIFKKGKASKKTAVGGSGHQGHAFSESDFLNRCDDRAHGRSEKHMAGDTTAVVSSYFALSQNEARSGPKYQKQKSTSNGEENEDEDEVFEDSDNGYSSSEDYDSEEFEDVDLQQDQGSDQTTQEQRGRPLFRSKNSVAHSVAPRSRTHELSSVRKRKPQTSKSRTSEKASDRSIKNSPSSPETAIDGLLDHLLERKAELDRPRLETNLAMTTEAVTASPQVAQTQVPLTQGDGWKDESLARLSHNDHSNIGSAITGRRFEAEFDVHNLSGRMYATNAVPAAMAMGPPQPIEPPWLQDPSIQYAGSVYLPGVQNDRSYEPQQEQYISRSSRQPSYVDHQQQQQPRTWYQCQPQSQYFTRQLPLQSLPQPHEYMPLPTYGLQQYQNSGVVDHANDTHHCRSQTLPPNLQTLLNSTNWAPHPADQYDIYHSFTADSTAMSSGQYDEWVVFPDSATGTVSGASNATAIQRFATQSVINALPNPTMTTAQRASTSTSTGTGTMTSYHSTLRRTDSHTSSSFQWRPHRLY